jgi:AsmA family
MNRLRKWWRPALALLILLILLQVVVSLMVRTRRIHSYLVQRLERSFGRPVEVSSFNLLLLPSPRLDASRVTIGEDPAFGSEYFLRAESLTAHLHLRGLLRGHFEFGALHLNRPSLILVRNLAGRWNLEGWLPPAKTVASRSGTTDPPAASPSNRLQAIEIDDGRINFKLIDEKLAFAFIAVSGSIEQVSAGRWQLQLQAQPWRSGAPLQSSGTVFVRGDVAGTSLRLQPAEIHLHWDQASLADILRLIRGHDYGVRGVFALDAAARSVGSDPGSEFSGHSGDWEYAVQARASEIHRWDLNERRDNPRVNLNLQGHWNAGSGVATAEHLVVESLQSNLRGIARASTSGRPGWEVRIDSAGIQAADALAWYRAFQPGVDDAASVRQYFTGAFSLSGWPLVLKDAAFSSNEGEVHVPGIASPVQIGTVQGGLERSELTVEPLRIVWRAAFPEAADDTVSAEETPRRKPTPAATGLAVLSVAHDFNSGAGAVSVNARVERVQDVLKTLSAFGRPRNFGWDLSGAIAANLRWEWHDSPRHAHWNGYVEASHAEVKAAGLNQPLLLNKARVEWKDGLRTAQIAEIDGFGGVWSGQIAQAELPDPDSDTPPTWNFQLHADHLDATELDRWIGPRARPGWLQRLLPAILGNQAQSSSGSELVRRVNAEGELRIDQFTMEKLTLQQVRAVGSLHDLHLDVRDAQAQWAGGTVHARVSAKFLPRPTYDVSADIDRVNLAQLPAPRMTQRFSGIASGALHLTTHGVGRDELLQNLAGRGDCRMRNVEFRGWDISTSVADGKPHIGESSWAIGHAAFALRDRQILLSGMRLESGHDVTVVKGSVSFGQDADLLIQTGGLQRREPSSPETGHILRISGPLDLPRISVEESVARLPAD